MQRGEYLAKIIKEEIKNALRNMKNEKTPSEESIEVNIKFRKDFFLGKLFSTV